MSLQQKRQPIFIEASSNKQQNFKITFIATSLLTRSVFHRYSTAAKGSYESFLTHQVYYISVIGPVI